MTAVGSPGSHGVPANSVVTRPAPPAYPHIPRRNNFDLVRLLLASMVVVWHTVVLSSHPALAFLHKPWFDGLWAVRGFFVISGFLIFQSIERSDTLLSYFEKRIRRLAPAYITVVLVCAMVGALVTTLPLQEYFGGAWLSYIVNNLALMNYRHPDLPGVFGAKAVNGALWTIKIEVSFYLVAPLLAFLFRKWRRGVLMAILYIASITYYLVLLHQQTLPGDIAAAKLAKQLPGQLCYFVSGGALYYFYPWFAAHRKVLLPLALVAFAAAIFYQPLYFLIPASLAILVIGLAFGPYCGNAGRYGDFSYGIYIWHFPIIQIVVTFGLFAQSLALGLSAVGLAVTAAGWLSWKLIENPFLQNNSHYVVAARPHDSPAA